MDKRELVARAARKTNLTNRQVREALDAVLETIAEGLAAGEAVALSDFGRFVAQAHPRQQVHGFDGQPCQVESRPIPAFKSSAVLRRRLKESE